MKFYINPGDFKLILEIQKYEAGQDSDGIPIERWTTVYTTKAKVVNIKFEEFLIAQGQGLREIKKFYIRYPKAIKINRKHRLKLKDDAYNIVSIDNVQNKNQYLELKGENIE